MTTQNSSSFNAPDLPGWAHKWMTTPSPFKAAYGGRGGGKALFIDTPIATLDGWSTMGDLAIGDTVFDEQGNPCKVTAVYPQGKQPIWGVSFRGGETIYASGDHLWVTSTHQSRRKNYKKGENPFRDWQNNFPITTTQMAETLRHGKRSISVHSIPLAAGLNLPEQDLLIPPYALGLWLGDGTSTQAAITAMPTDAEYYRQILFSEGEILGAARHGSVHRTAHTYPISREKDKGQEQSFLYRLRKLNLYDNKHIPDQYKRASYQQRLQLLQGLMDTDGHITQSGIAEFSSSNPVLAEDVEELILTLGMKANLKEKVIQDGKRTFCIEFYPDIKVASLPRKAERIREKSVQKYRTRQWMITDVWQTGVQGEMVCIEVDSPSRLFLAGRSLIPTHNSWAIACMLIIMMLSKKVRIACVREVQKSIDQSVKQLVVDWIERMGLQSAFIVRKTDIECVETGSLMFFRGMGTATETQTYGLEGVDIVWFEEAQAMSEASRRILYPTIRKPGSEIWFSFNPQTRNDPVYKDFVSKDSRVPNALTFNINYDSNPWFTDKLEAERQRCQEFEPEIYNHVWLGHPLDDDDRRILLPLNLVQQCIEAWEKKPNVSAIRMAGLDVADRGTDKNAFAIRQGPLLESVETWSVPTIGDTARRVHQRCLAEGIQRLYYDEGGLGSGVRSYFREFQDLDKVPYWVEGVLFGSSVTGDDIEYSFRVTQKDFFAHRNSQLAWNLRQRAQQTIRYLAGEPVDPMNALFINPNIERIDRLVEHLTQVEWKENTTSHIVIDKDKNESLPSPDMYDAVVLAFAWDTRNGLRGIRSEHLLRPSDGSMPRMMDGVVGALQG